MVVGRPAKRLISLPVGYLISSHLSPLESPLGAFLPSWRFLLTTARIKWNLLRFGACYCWLERCRHHAWLTELIQRICYLRAVRKAAKWLPSFLMLAPDAVGCSSSSTSSSECAACSPSIDFQWRCLLFRPVWLLPPPFIHSSLSVPSSFGYVPSYFPVPNFSRLIFFHSFLCLFDFLLFFFPSSSSFSSSSLFIFWFLFPFLCLVFGINLRLAVTLQERGGGEGGG